MSTNTWTFNPMPVDPYDAIRMYITGPSIVDGASYYLRRVIGSLHEPLVGPIIAGHYTDNTPVLFVEDYLYPLDTTFAYELLDATNTLVLDKSANVGPVPSGGYPWIKDLIYPAQRIARTVIVDITDRTYGGRITPYYLVANKYPVTVGDVRSASTGTLTVLCRTHAERDEVIEALSSGGPCQLRTPCSTVVDDMYFTPGDINEARVGITGACMLAVDFTEVSPTDIAPFRAVSYAQQTQNAIAASAMKYSGLRDAFAFHTYRDMALSQSGIAP